MLRLRQSRTGKYGSKKITTPDGTFDSKHEFERFCELHILLRAGEIRKLERQVRFPLLPAKSGEFRAERPCDYIADFVYEEKRGDTWVQVVEDAKSEATKRKESYIIKRKLMLAINNISIKEV